MKYIIVILLALCGCTSTRISTDGKTWSINRTSFLQKTSIPHLVVKGDKVELVGCSQESDDETIRKAIEIILKAVVIK